MKHFAIFILFIFGFVRRPEKFQWMDRNYTTAIKGFAIKPAMISIFIFIVITCVFVCILYVGIRKIKNDRFNSCNTYKK